MSSLSEEELRKKYDDAKQKLEDIKQNYIIVKMVQNKLIKQLKDI